MTDDTDLADLIRANATVMLLQPADVLILSNVDGLTQEGFERICGMKDDLGVSAVYVFAGDIDITVLRAMRPDDTVSSSALSGT
jgi:hypothetical protein